MYYSYDPNGDGYVEHSTEEEAKKSAQAALDYERDKARECREYMLGKNNWKNFSKRTNIY